MLGGSTSVQCHVSPIYLSAFSENSWRMPAGVHGHGGFDSRFRAPLWGRSENSRQYLSPVWKSLRRMQEELH
jgi:hypothetical protein